MASRVAFIESGRRGAHGGDLVRRLDRLGTDAAARQAVGRLVRDLAGATDLPAPTDLLTLIERQGRLPTLAYGRRVPGHSLWVWYLATDEQLQIVGLTSAPHDV